MELTSQELKQLDRLRKQERQWPRTRWIMLTAGVFNAAIYGYVMGMVVHRLFHSGNDPASTGELFSSFNIFLFAFIWPLFLLMICHSGWFIVEAIRDWHGNINRRLLLKLLEAQQNQPPGPNKTI